MITHIIYCSLLNLFLHYAEIKFFLTLSRHLIESCNPNFSHYFLLCLLVISTVDLSVLFIDQIILFIGRQGYQGCLPLMFPCHAHKTITQMQSIQRQGNVMYRHNVSVLPQTHYLTIFPLYAYSDLILN